MIVGILLVLSIAGQLQKMMAARFEFPDLIWKLPLLPAAQDDRSHYEVMSVHEEWVRTA
jgi:hypothetical protein